MTEQAWAEKIEVGCIIGGRDNGKVRERKNMKPVIGGDNKILLFLLSPLSTSKYYTGAARITPAIL